MRFPSLDNVLSLMVVWVLCLDLEFEEAAPICECFGDEFEKCVCIVLWALQVATNNCGYL